MQKKHVLIIGAVSLGLAAWFGAIWALKPSSDPPAEEIEHEPTAYDYLLDARQARAEAAIEKDEHLFQQPDPQAGINLWPFAVNAGGKERTLLQIELSRSAFREARSNSHDRDGLDHLIAGRYAESVLAFGRSSKADAKRGLPELFRGIALIEQAKWSYAVRALDSARQDPFCMPAAKYLHAWAVRCARRPPANDLEAGHLLLESIESLPRPESKKGEYYSGYLGIWKTPALLWARGEAYNLRHEKLKGMLAAEADHKLREPAVYVAFGSERFEEKFYQHLNDRYPSHLAVRTVLAFESCEYLDNEEIEAKWPQVQAAADRLLAQDPGNGLYHLLRIKPLEYESKSIRNADGTYTDVDLTVPFSDAELAAMRRLVEAPRVEDPGVALDLKSRRLRQRYLGGFVRGDNESRLGSFTRWMLQLNGRFISSHEKLLEAGELERAEELCKLYIAVGRRLAQIKGLNSFVIRIVNDSIPSYADSVRETYAQKTGDRETIRRMLPRMIAHERKWMKRLGLIDLEEVASSLPIARAHRASQAVERAVAFQPDLPVLRLAYRRFLREGYFGEPTSELELVTELREAIDKPDSRTDDVVARLMIKIADREVYRAASELKRMASDETLYLSEVARWALSELGRKQADRK